MATPKLPEQRKFDPTREEHCFPCTHCCEYVAVQIDKPHTWKDFDHIIWYVLHKHTWVYIDHDGDWHIQFNTPCEKLQDSRCHYYKNRPVICRDYHPQDCVRHSDGAPEAYLFRNEQDVMAYLKKKRPATYKKIAQEHSHT